MRQHGVSVPFAGLALFLLLLMQISGCAPAVSGVSGMSLVRTGYPRLTVGAREPMQLQGYGRQWVSLPTDYLGLQPTGSMDYAVYAEETEGPVERHAHVLVARPLAEREWRFKPESFPGPGGLALGRVVIDGYTWTLQTLRVDGEKDWFSAMWRENGRDVPERWIAVRYSATPDWYTRVVAEYREPWPECLDPEIKDLIFVRKSCLEGFYERSEAVFSLDMHAPEVIEKPAAPSRLEKPPFSPDMKRLAGELLKEDFFLRNWR